MLYIEKEYQMGEYWYSFCKDNLGKKYQQWLVPCRLLDITPAEFAELLVKEYGSIVKYSPNSPRGPFLSYYWANQRDEAKWRNFINKKAREKSFQI